MNKKFKVILILLLLLAVLPLLPATNYQLLTVRADWSTNFSIPTCQITGNTSVTVGESANFTVTSTNSPGITSISVSNGDTLFNDTTPPYPTSKAVTWNTTGKTAGKSYTINAYIVSPNDAGNVVPVPSSNPHCTATITVNNPPQPPAACFNSTWNKAYIWTGGNYCYMNWWDSRCTVNLYDWVNPWTVTNFYVKAHDNWNNWDWTVCDTRWGSWGLCTRNWSVGYSNQSVAFNNPYYTIGTKYSLIQRTTNWNNQAVETELANTCASGLRYQMPAPQIQYDYTLTNFGTCLATDATGNALARIYFPTSNPFRQISWVDISTDPNFSSYYNKAVPAGATWIDAPNGFNGASGVSGPLTIQPNRTYYVRLYGYDSNTRWSTYWFNGNYGWWSAVSVIRLPLCPAAVDGRWDMADAAWNTTCNQCGNGFRTRLCNSPAPENGGAECRRINGTLTTPFNRWENCSLTPCAIDGGWDFPDGPAWNNLCSEACGPGFKTRNCINPVPAFGGQQCLKADGTRGLWETQNCNLKACLTPWIQTEGGDVHSNTRIRAPGGP